MRQKYKINDYIVYAIMSYSARISAKMYDDMHRLIREFDNIFMELVEQARLNRGGN